MMRIKNKMILWMKTTHYPNKIRSHLVTIVPMAPFTPKSTSKLRSALQFRYSIVIPSFIQSSKTIYPDGIPIFFLMLIFSVKYDVTKCHVVVTKLPTLNMVGSCHYN